MSQGPYEHVIDCSDPLALAMDRKPSEAAASLLADAQDAQEEASATRMYQAAALARLRESALRSREIADLLIVMGLDE